jgi:glycosyltransferase involved in cell wall biosynthesis
MNPRFSVLLPTKNRLTYLRYAVESVRRQDYANWEIVVSDNASEEDIAGYVASLNDPRIVYLRTKSALHVTANWNNALEHARGDYLIMLGDDDGLTKGYFSRMVALLAEHGSPEMIFCNAFIYAYPDVVPGFPAGFLKRDASPLFAHPAPYLLPHGTALELVRSSLRFTMSYPFNMQYSLVGRALVERLRQRGSFYQSPYPDYYATNALLLEAATILIQPAPSVIIGVSPKSYGFYHFNNKEDEGALFLDNAPAAAEAARLRDVLLPGTRSASAWLLAMEALRLAFPALKLTVDYARYRRMQLGTMFKRRHLLGDLPAERYRDFLARLSWSERWLGGLPLALALRASRLLGHGSHRRILDFIRRCSGNSHAGSLDLAGQACCATSCRTLLEVFEQGGAPLAHATTSGT